MENLKTQNIRLMTNNTNENDLFKPLDIYSQNHEEFFSQGKDINILSEYYNKKKGNSEFVEKIGKLNKKFYNCSENYIKAKKKLENLNDDLYMNLFKQINCYVEEIERLNKKLILNNNQDLKKTIDSLNKDIKEKKEKIRNYEIKLKEKSENEEKLMKEIESYKRRIIFYKDKIKIGLLSRNRNNEFKMKDNAYYLNNQKNSSKNNNYLFSNSDKKLRIYFDKNNINKEDSSIKPLNTINDKEIIPEKEEKEYYKTEIKNQKLRESIYKTEDNHYPTRTKNFSDIYDNDNENYILEKREEIYSDNEGMLNLNLNLESDSQNFSSKLSNKQSKEIFLEQDSDAKNKTFDGNNKGKNDDDNQFEKNSGKLQQYKKNEIKSKLLSIDKKEKEENGNKVIKINFDMRNNTDKSRKLVKTTKSKPSNKANYRDKISKFSDTKTPLMNNKFTKKFVISKVRPESIKANKNRKTQINNNRLTTDQNQLYNNNRLNLTNNKEMNNSEYLNRGNKLNLDKANQQIIRNKNINRKKFIENNKDNKDLNVVLKIVNDDYLNSIEMLNAQEEQIKTMLKLMDLNEK